MLRRLGASGICAPRRRGPRVAQAVRTIGALRSFIWRVACIQ
ncbi:hypothetical protein A2U01_0115416, partial [Trifolium medium]|nr:hypothetical protein [Trifolium medium]